MDFPLESIFLAILISCPPFLKTISTLADESSASWLISSDNLATLIDFNEVAPSTNINASRTLLFPEPFAPTIAVNPFESGRSAFLNDLKFLRISFSALNLPVEFISGRLTLVSLVFLTAGFSFSM